MSSFSLHRDAARPPSSPAPGAGSARPRHLPGLFPLPRRAVLALAGLAAAGLLAACTGFAPVHSGRLAAPIPLAYAEPRTRLEQIVYQELALRLGSADGPAVPLVTVAIASAIAPVGLSAPEGPGRPQQVTLTGRLTVAPRDGTGEPVTVTRTATASYAAGPQGLAGDQARIEAEERAARALAESLRLALLAGLARTP